MYSSQHRLLLKRSHIEYYNFNDCTGRTWTHHLSALSTNEEQVLSEDILKLPFSLKKYDDYDFNSCSGIIWFDNYSCDDEIVVWNPTTGEIRTLVPPAPGHEPEHIYVLFSGLGYDSISEDYKFIRIISPPRFEADGRFFRGYTTRAELYSFNRDSWKEISNLTMPHSQWSGSAYVDGSYYWEAMFDRHYWILSFDFASETFSTLPMPGSSFDYKSLVINFDGSLGVLRFPWANPLTTTLSIELWVLNLESLWTRVFDVSLDGVGSPLGFGGNACRLLFCEAMCGTKLLVYDRITQELNEVDNYDMRFTMDICSYVETTNPLPQPKHTTT